ncbi:MAG: hypothetical protein SCARUB_04280 [Candidatus Scalindua rubra]|uniref:YokE-like PH domain-containing protein n=1 Tax=Candidatus Scalindua rubra TaxID=1872076 RepID=A0A1E3X4R5_9BACT|nr:MAG: hypothetical protein SCARUB_04280 [Candidatus Scalindua rubra]
MDKGQGKFNLAENNKIASAVEQTRQQNAPKTFDGDKVVKYAQVAFDGGNALRSTWKMGSLFLTEKKLIFLQGQNRIFESDLDSIVDISIIDRDWIPGKMVEQVCLTRKKRDLKRRFYFCIKKPEIWEEKIEQLINPSTPIRIDSEQSRTNKEKPVNCNQVS